MDPLSIGLGILGLGVGLFSADKQAKSQRDMYSQQMSMLQSVNSGSAQSAQATMPAAPASPADPAAQNDEATAAREETLRQAAAQNQAVNPTSGLGLTNLPNLYKRTLGGAA